MRKHLLIITAVTGCTVLTLSAQVNNPTSPGLETPTVGTADSTSSTSAQAQPDSKSKQFLKTAFRDNQMEMALADVAMQKAQNQQLKSFAQQLHQDHQAAHQQLQPLAQKYGIDLADASKAKTGGVVSKLQNMETGAKWDQRFAEETLKQHAKDIEAYHKAVENVQAEDVKQFAQTQLPKLQQHFQHAKTVAQTVGVDQETIASHEKKLPTSALGGTSDQQDTGSFSGSTTNQGTSSSEMREPKQQGTTRDLNRGNPTQ